MFRAYDRVVKNKGAAGVDDMTVGELKEYLQKEWLGIKAKLLSGNYKPQPVKRVEILKPNGKMRKLGIPTVVDRLIQQSLHQVLESLKEPKLRVPKESVQKFRLKLKAKFRSGKGRNLLNFIKDSLNSSIKGWINYFKLAGVRSFAKDLDGWIRRHLRKIKWRQWKRPWTRRKELMKRGLNEERSVTSAFNQRGPW